MDSIKKIAETIRHDIDLHKQLSEMVIEESKHFAEGNPDYVDRYAMNRAKLEKEIESTNRSIVNLFLVSDVDSEDVDVESKKEVVVLMNQLRETIKKTLDIVNNRVAHINKDKALTSIRLKEFSKSRIALNSYARYGTI